MLSVSSHFLSYPLKWQAYYFLNNWLCNYRKWKSNWRENHTWFKNVTDIIVLMKWKDCLDAFNLLGTVVILHTGITLESCDLGVLLNFNKMKTFLNKTTTIITTTTTTTPLKYWRSVLPLSFKQKTYGTFLNNVSLNFRDYSKIDSELM